MQAQDAAVEEHQRSRLGVQLSAAQQAHRLHAEQECQPRNGAFFLICNRLEEKTRFKSYVMQGFRRLTQHAQPRNPKHERQRAPSAHSTQCCCYC